MTTYRQLYDIRATPQSEPVPDREAEQVVNSAGGYTFALDDWGRLDRFLILGADAPTYYASARKLARENAAVVVRCATADPARAVKVIIDVSESGRAPRNDAALFALAMAAASENTDARRLALAALPRVARTGEHLFQFVDYAEGLRGWGRGMRGAVARWYTAKDVPNLAYQVVKYQQRHGWSHRDLLRLAKPRPPNGAHDAIYYWATKGKVPPAGVPSLVYAYDAAHAGFEDRDELLSLIRTHRMTHEMLPSENLADPDVWRALLDHMPLTAMIRNLGRMTANGTLQRGNDAAHMVVERLADADRIRKARVHPLAALVALNTYQRGQGVKGGLEWTPIPAVVDALDGAFYTAFGNVEPTGKRLLLALDVSGSMETGEVAGMTGVTPRVGSAAMAMATLAADQTAHVVGFTAGAGRSWMLSPAVLTPLDISPRRRLDDVVKSISDLNFGGTDCSLPMRYALERGLEVDAFLVYTDNETWAGKIHPFQALRQYRERTGIAAKLIIVGMTSTGFTIADPNDAGMMDVVGFDTAAPNVMSGFIRGAAVGELT